MTDLKTLAMAANSAHPCIPWHNSDDLIAIGIDDDCDADFVAAASPDAILNLLAERDRLREALRDAVAALGGITSDNVPETVRQALDAAP